MRKDTYRYRARGDHQPAIRVRIERRFGRQKQRARHLDIGRPALHHQLSALIQAGTQNRADSESRKRRRRTLSHSSSLIPSWSFQSQNLVQPCLRQSPARSSLEMIGRTALASTISIPPNCSIVSLTARRASSVLVMSCFVSCDHSHTPCSHVVIRPIAPLCVLQ